MPKFSVGTKVKISKSSEYYTDGPKGRNPKDLVGTITTNNRDTSHIYRVDWSNGQWNTYRDKDLVLPNSLVVIEEEFKKALGIVCLEWKNKLVDWYGKAILLTGQAEVTEDQLRQMREASQYEREEIRELFKSIFPNAKQVTTIGAIEHDKVFVNIASLKEGEELSYGVKLSSCNGGGDIYLTGDLDTIKAIATKGIQARNLLNSGHNNTQVQAVEI